MKGRLAALALLLASLGVATVRYELRRPFRGYSGSQLVEISPGTRAPEVASLLVARGVLAYRWPFLLRYWLGRRRHRLKAGEYFFDQPFRPVDVHRKLVQGEVYLHAVAIPEGSDRFDIARILQEQLGVNPDEFLRITENSSPIRDLDPRAPTLEGYLFPDTYRFARGVSSATAAAAMVTRFRRVFDSKLHQEPNQLPMDLHSVMTLASLVEKETPEPSERPIIAGVFMRRLEKGWPLQCDPTVVYAARLGHRLIGGSFAPIKQSDLNSDSPYNTYRHPGLPPGPISNPGEASIQAAINPATGNVLYFVSNNNGGHTFARTLAEHQRNVARYRRQLAQLRGHMPEGAGLHGPLPKKKSAAPKKAETVSAKSATHAK